MKRPMFQLCACIFLLQVSASVAPAQVRLRNEQVLEMLRHRVLDEKQGIAIVAGVLDEGGTRVIGFGPPFLESGLTVDANTLFEIGSITKTFTTILLADMVERGEVRLDDPISKYLPPPLTAPMRNGKEITLRHLATHTSGLPRMPGNFAPLWWNLCFFCTDAGQFYAGYSLEKMYAFLSSHNLQKDIEGQIEYSNYGMALLGQILAARAGMDYETLVRSRITGPLGMNDTVIRLSPEKKTRFARGHGASGKRVDNWDISQAFAPAGGLRSSVNDLFKYLRANLEMTPTPLGPAIQRTHQPQYSNGFGGIYGLGWQILRELDSEILHHGGGTGGYVSFIGFNPKRRAGVVVLSNSGNNIKDVGLHLLDPAQFPLDKVAKERRAIAVNAATLDAYVGEYQGYRTGKSPRLGEGLEILTSYYLKVTREGTRLFVEPAGQRKVEVFAESDSDFFWLPRDAKETLILPDAQASFVRDSSGAVSHLVLHSNGIHQFARKVR